MSETLGLEVINNKCFAVSFKKYRNVWYDTTGSFWHVKHCNDLSLLSHRIRLNTSLSKFANLTNVFLQKIGKLGNKFH